MLPALLLCGYVTTHTPEWDAAYFHTLDLIRRNAEIQAQQNRERMQDDRLDRLELEERPYPGQRDDDDDR